MFVNPLEVPEIVGLVLSQIEKPQDLITCLQVNKLWFDESFEPLRERLDNMSETRHQLMWTSPSRDTMMLVFSGVCYFEARFEGMAQHDTFVKGAILLSTILSVLENGTVVDPLKLTKLMVPNMPPAAQIQSHVLNMAINSKEAHGDGDCNHHPVVEALTALAQVTQVSSMSLIGVGVDPQFVSCLHQNWSGSCCFLGSLLTPLVTSLKNVRLDIPALSELKPASLQETPGLDRTMIADVARHCKSLETFYVNRLRGCDVKDLVQIAQCPNLTTLEIQIDKVSDTARNRLSLSDLQTLDLCGRKLTRFVLTVDEIRLTQMSFVSMIFAIDQKCPKMRELELNMMVMIQNNAVRRRLEPPPGAGPADRVFNSGALVKIVDAGRMYELKHPRTRREIVKLVNEMSSEQVRCHEYGDWTLHRPSCRVQ